MVVFYSKSMRLCLYCKRPLERKEKEVLSAWKRRVFCDTNCRGHMSHYKTHGNPAIRTHKICPTCKLDKPLSNFTNNKNRPDFHGTTCIPCHRIKERLRRTGWDAKQYNEAFKKQNGKCAIKDCLEQIRAADHQHKTGKLRGLLCIKHNIVLHYFDDVVKYQAILDYLKLYN